MTSDVFGLLIWQLTVPVLIAIAIALPAGYFLMAAWLQGYVYRIGLSQPPPAFRIEGDPFTGHRGCA